MSVLRTAGNLIVTGSAPITRRRRTGGSAGTTGTRTRSRAIWMPGCGRRVPQMIRINLVVAPSSDTGSTTGHVAFYGGVTGNDVWLLGGNQGRKVCWMRKNKSSVRGYRWPQIMRDVPGRAGGTAVVWGERTVKLL